MLSIDKGNNAACSLCLGDDVQRNGGFTAGFWAVDLNDAATWHASDTKGNIQRKGARRNNAYLHVGVVTQLHDGALAELLFDLIGGDLQGFSFVLAHFFS